MPTTIISMFRSYDIPDEIICRIIYEYGGMVHPTAEIVRKELIDSTEYYRFNHIFPGDVKYNSMEANSYNPKKNGYHAFVRDGVWDLGYLHAEYEDVQRSTYFLHRDYDNEQSYEEYKGNAEYMYSHWRLFVYDGTTKYWNGSTPNYPKELMFTSKKGLVPVTCMVPEDETSTDRDRRHTEYRSSKCSWAIKEGCDCSESGGVCLRIRYNQI